MKQSFTIVILFLATNLCFSQEWSCSIDTIYESKDSTVVFVQKFIDSTLMKSYFGIFTDSCDIDFRYGFLGIKKGIMREYRIGKKWNVKEFDWRKKYQGLRGVEGELIISKRIE